MRYLQKWYKNVEYIWKTLKIINLTYNSFQKDLRHENIRYPGTFFLIKKLKKCNNTILYEKLYIK